MLYKVLSYTVLCLCLEVTKRLHETPSCLMLTYNAVMNVFLLCILDEALFVFVHNVDGSMIRNSAVQQALATLASADNIHLIASVDHINAPLCE